MGAPSLVLGVHRLDSNRTVAALADRPPRADTGRTVDSALLWLLGSGDKTSASTAPVEDVAGSLLGARRASPAPA
jgi:hypothetical protein